VGVAVVKREERLQGVLLAGQLLPSDALTLCVRADPALACTSLFVLAPCTTMLDTR